MSLFSAASQLAAAQDATSLASTAQVGAAAASVAGALQGGADRARGWLQSVAGEAQLRAGLLHAGGDGEGQARQVAADGLRCQGCGKPFGVWSRRSACTTCDRFLCAACLGSPLPQLVGAISCLCAATCPACAELGDKGREFHACKAMMEKGAAATVGIPVQAGWLGSGGDPRRLSAWVNLEGSSAELRWATLQQAAGRPAEEGSIRVCDILGVRGVGGGVVELSLRGQSEPTTLDFAEGGERDRWARGLLLAMEVLAPEGERVALAAERVQQRHVEMEVRRSDNEERKRKLQEGLGMRFTAEALARR
ncbi:unnamed protein product [Prorocentrum cordatum]|uniref:FYVE-type domain-containing protein n=1 Tax=Prorocentrum cordatum TaxID=2364126 RepID=A0ABN9QSY4_9DINO|nr:unnamed protein product [Polarella glacialis]